MRNKAVQQLKDQGGSETLKRRHAGLRLSVAPKTFIIQHCGNQISSAVWYSIYNMLYFYTFAEKQIIIKVWIPGISWPKLAATKTQEYANCTSKSAKNRFASPAMVPIQNYLSQMLKWYRYIYLHLISFLWFSWIVKYNNCPIEWTWVPYGYPDSNPKPTGPSNPRKKQKKVPLIRWFVFFHMDNMIRKIQQSIRNVAFKSFQKNLYKKNLTMTCKQDAFSVGDMKKSGTLVLQYCYVGSSQFLRLVFFSRPKSGFSPGEKIKLRRCPEVHST